MQWDQLPNLQRLTESGNDIACIPDTYNVTARKGAGNTSVFDQPYNTLTAVL